MGDVHEISYTIKGHKTNGLPYDMGLWDNVTYVMEGHGIKDMKWKDKRISFPNIPYCKYNKGRMGDFTWPLGMPW